VISADADIGDLAFPASIERLSSVIEIDGLPLGGVALPVCDRRVPAAIIVDAIASIYAWEIFLAFAKGGRQGGSALGCENLSTNRGVVARKR
jgi:hypothetical protein